MNEYVKIFSYFQVGLVIALLLLMDLVTISRHINNENNSELDSLGITISFGLYFLIPLVVLSFIFPPLVIISWKKLNRNNRIIGLVLPIILALIIISGLALKEFYIPILVSLIK